MVVLSNLQHFVAYWYIHSLIGWSEKKFHYWWLIHTKSNYKIKNNVSSLSKVWESISFRIRLCHTRTSNILLWSFHVIDKYRKAQICISRSREAWKYVIYKNRFFFFSFFHIENSIQFFFYLCHLILHNKRRENVLCTYFPNSIKKNVSCCLGSFHSGKKTMNFFFLSKFLA